MQEDKIQIQVRRHPLVALLLIALGLGSAFLGFWFELYGVLFLGGAILVISGFFLWNPALIVTDKTVELRGLFGNRGRVIPHDGLKKLRIDGQQLVIEHAGRRATLPRPKGSSLHPADWAFLAKSLEKAHNLK